jgi:hypothetical protein
VDTVGDLPVKAIQKEHVGVYKRALLNGISKRDGKSPVEVATVQKLLNVLRAVLEWANREGIVESNVAHGVSRVAALSSKARYGRRAEDAVHSGAGEGDHCETAS